MRGSLLTIVLPFLLPSMLELTWCSGWLDAVHGIWRTEGIGGMFRASIPRIMWYIPASALTFMAVEFLTDHFNETCSNGKMQEVASLSIDKKGSSLQEHMPSDLQGSADYTVVATTLL